MKRGGYIERKSALRRKKPMRRAAPRRVTRPGPGSDPAHLEEVRKLPCAARRYGVTLSAAGTDAACEGDVVAHHAGPKNFDRGAVPLCWKHHQQWHDANGVFKGWNKYERRMWAEALIGDTQRIIDNGLDG